MPDGLDTTQLLSLINFSPRSPIDLNIPTLPLFTLTFNLPINANLVNTAQGLNQFILLVDRTQEIGQTIPVTSGAVDSVGRTLTFYPTQPLNPGSTYQVTLKKELRSAAGRAMIADRIWTFTVDLSALGQVSPLIPGDATAYNTTPVLYWEGVAATGNITYRAQLDTTFLFSSPLWETAPVVSTSGGVQGTAIGVPLSDRTEYFWRVRAETVNATGSWSAIQSFYLGDAIQASPDTKQLYDVDPFFRLLDFAPENGTTNQSHHPTIVATFSQPLDPATVNTNNVQLFVSTVDGRSDVPEYQDLNAVYNVGANSKLLIAPSVIIQPNHRYTIVLNPALKSASGSIFKETFESYYTSFYKPLYGGIIGVRSRLGGFVNTVSDDEVLFHLWRASMHVNELLATRVFRVRDRISYDEAVVYDPPFKTWGQYQYAELHATVHLIQSFYYDLLQDSGRRVALSTFEHEIHVDILAELREQLKEVRKEMWAFGARFLRENCLPRVGMKGQFFNPVREQNPLARSWADHPRRTF